MSEETTSKHQQESDEAKKELEAIQDDPPKNLEDWPGGKAKYQTFGGEETQSGYGEGPTENLGPADLRHHEDGSVTIKGEPVDDPDQYKGEPIPGGPTDPDAPKDLGSDEEAEEAKQERDDG